MFDLVIVQLEIPQLAQLADLLRQFGYLVVLGRQRRERHQASECLWVKRTYMCKHVWIRNNDTHTLHLDTALSS